MKSKKKFSGGANVNVNENTRVNYIYNPLNNQQALESINDQYVIGYPDTFGRKSTRRTLKINPEGDGESRIASRQGIRVKNLTNESRHEFLSKPRKYTRSTKHNSKWNLLNHSLKTEIAKHLLNTSGTLARTGRRISRNTQQLLNNEMLTAEA